MSNLDEHSFKVTQKNNYIITLLGTEKLAFPAWGVKEILLFTRDQLLPLPFYNKQLVGMIHHQGQVVPLISLNETLQGKPTELLKTNLVAIRLNEKLKNLNGVGILIDKIVKNLNEEELAEEKIFNGSDISKNIWQPQRWYSSNLITI